MKKFTAKEFVSLAVVVLVASGFALAVVLSAGTAVAANDYLLLALTLCGAVLSGINGFGRRTVKADTRPDRSRSGPRSGVALTS